MANKFACEILFMKNGGSMPEIERFQFLEYNLIVASVRDIEDDGANVKRDLFDPLVADSEHLQKLDNGTWRMYVFGEVHSELNMDISSFPGGKKEMLNYIFEEKEMFFAQLYELNPKLIHVKVVDNKEK